MATELKKIKLTSVDLVRAGANQAAEIDLFKSAPTDPEAYHEALSKSVRSILDDPELEPARRSEMLAKTVEEYRAATEEQEEEEEPEADGEEVMVEKEPEEEAAADPEEIDTIEEVEKSSFTSGDRCDTIVEVEKFNPFHDARGRFASKNGFKTYSANPKMKVAQPSIIRSAQAGHTSTMNVHAESKGENIGQNYTWLQTGQKPAFLNSAQQTPPKPQKPQKPQKPKQQNQPDPNTKKPTADQSIQNAVAGVNLSSSDKLALQARDGNGQACSTKKAADDYSGTRIEGQDISKTFDYHALPSAAMNNQGSIKTYAIDEVAKAQGWDKAPPTVISNRDDFDKLCLANGRVMMRTVHAGHGMTAEEVATATMTRSDIALGAGGGNAYGGGLYLVDTKIAPGKPVKVTGSDVAEGQRESYAYGDTQMMATPRPGAKIATPKQAAAMKSEFMNLPFGDRARFQDDYGAYIASKGYDGAKWHADTDPSAYLTMYNKSALVFFSEVAEK